MSMVRKDERKTGRISSKIEPLALCEHRGLIFRNKVGRPGFWYCHCPK